MKNFFFLLITGAIVKIAHLQQGECNWKHSGHVWCEGDFRAESENELKEKLTNFEDPFFVFEIFRATFDALPRDIFEKKTNAEVNTVIFDEVSLSRFHIPENKISPFESIKNSLVKFEVYDTNGVFAWDWNSFPNMKNFQILIVENSAMISVADDFVFAPDLRLIELRNSKIKWLSPKLFKSNINLTFCSLAKNEIEIVNRSMFPQPATKLWSLDFSDNQLSVLPEDLFSGMPSLRELKLDNNHFTSIFALREIWTNLTQLWLQGIPLKCDQTYMMLKQKEHRPLFFDSSKCKQENDETAIPFAMVRHSTPSGTVLLKKLTGYENEN